MLVRFHLLWSVCILLFRTVHNVNCDLIDVFDRTAVSGLCTIKECSKPIVYWSKDCLEYCSEWKKLALQMLFPSPNDNFCNCTKPQSDVCLNMCEKKLPSLNSRATKFYEDEICNQICPKNRNLCNRWCEPNGFNQTATCSFDFCMTEPRVSTIFCRNLCIEHKVCSEENCKVYPKLRMTICYGMCSAMKKPRNEKGPILPPIISKVTEEDDMERTEFAALSSDSRCSKSAEHSSKESDDLNLLGRDILPLKFQENQGILGTLLAKCKCFTPKQLRHCNDICAALTPRNLILRNSEPKENLEKFLNDLLLKWADTNFRPIFCSENFYKTDLKIALQACKSLCTKQQTCTVEDCQEFFDLITQVRKSICPLNQNRKWPSNLPISQLPQAETECLNERSQFDQQSCSFYDCLHNPASRSCDCLEFIKQRACISIICERFPIIKSEFCGGVCKDSILEATNGRMFRAKGEDNDCLVENCFDLKKEDRCWKTCQEKLKSVCSPQLCRSSAYFRRICEDDCKGKKSEAE